MLTRSFWGLFVVLSLGTRVLTRVHSAFSFVLASLLLVAKGHVDDSSLGFHRTFDVTSVSQSGPIVA